MKCCDAHCWRKRAHNTQQHTRVKTCRHSRVFVLKYEKIGSAIRDTKRRCGCVMCCGWLAALLYLLLHITGCVHDHIWASALWTRRYDTLSSRRWSRLGSAHGSSVLLPHSALRLVLRPTAPSAAARAHVTDDGAIEVRMEQKQNVTPIWSPWLLVIDKWRGKIKIWASRHYWGKVLR